MRSQVRYEESAVCKEDGRNTSMVIRQEMGVVAREMGGEVARQEAGVVGIQKKTMGVVGEREVGVVRFQMGNTATTDSLLDTRLGLIPTLRQVTLVLHLKLHRLTSHIPLLSYAVHNSSQELFVELVPKKKDLHVQCCGGLVSEAFPFTLKMFVWQHICISLDLPKRVLRVIYDLQEYEIDLQLPKMSVGESVEVRGGGRLVVGQRLYSLDGDFLVVEILDGEVGDWRLYDTYLSRSELQEWTNCKNLTSLNDPILDLFSEGFMVRGPTQLSKMPSSEICDLKSTKFFLFFDRKMKFNLAESWCRKLKGELVLPESEEVNADFYDSLFIYKDQCKDIWTHLYWIGMRGNLTTQQWVKVRNGAPITWSKFLHEYRQVTPEFQCVATVTHDRYKWVASPCDIETCVVCNFTFSPVVNLRGLCSFTFLDHRYSFRGNDEMELVFDGKAHMVMEKRQGTWVMRSRLYPDLNATMMVDFEGQYPLGIHRWNIHGDRYQSDELYCDVVLVPNGYSPRLPPPAAVTPLYISLDVNIISIREIDLTAFQISLDMRLEMVWRDSRLQYKNLQDNMWSNKLWDHSEVWTPGLKLKDGTGGAVTLGVDSQNVFVVKASRPLPDDVTILREDERYSGADNDLVLVREMILTFKCHFQLHMYPFDRQMCRIVISLQDVTKEVGVLAKQEEGGVAFIGERNLLEYTVTSETFSIVHGPHVSSAMIGLEFHNQFRYYIANTLMPSLMQVIICFTTLLFHITDFQDRIVVSLSSLLLLATFFSQTSQSIPRTSYLKLIDAWFVVLICQVFSIIMALVYIETKRPRQDVTSNQINVDPTETAHNISELKDVSHYNPLSRAIRANRFFLMLFSVSIVSMMACFVPIFTYNVLA
ncbi:hypothetical protein Pmani_020016 [Petrolisthes manimaculis]|uniref:C-type lectin domain-containing protein n=1 Tax=Petrolisthes manimaculis TaxID=1843537 RepID=A0AAE1PJK2_9EUCA|nr:hypothetical protein Pmani_020016 [Petrolisthes manimaculis]